MDTPYKQTTITVTSLAEIDGLYPTTITISLKGETTDTVYYTYLNYSIKMDNSDNTVLALNYKNGTLKVFYDESIKGVEINDGKVDLSEYFTESFTLNVGVGDGDITQVKPQPPFEITDVVNLTPLRNLFCIKVDGQPFKIQTNTANYDINFNDSSSVQVNFTSVDYGDRTWYFSSKSDVFVDTVRDVTQYNGLTGDGAAKGIISSGGLNFFTAGQYEVSDASINDKTFTKCIRSKGFTITTDGVTDGALEDVKVYSPASNTYSYIAIAVVLISVGVWYYFA